MTSFEIKSLERFVEYLVCLCFVAGFLGLYVAYGFKWVCAWVESKLEGRLHRARMDRIFGKVGEP